MDCGSDYALAAFSGTLLALLVVWVLTGRADELRRGVRSLFDVKESYTPVKLSDYTTNEEEEEEEEEES